MLYLDTVGGVGCESSDREFDGSSKLYRFCTMSELYGHIGGLSIDDLGRGYGSDEKVVHI